MIKINWVRNTVMILSLSLSLPIIGQESKKLDSLEKAQEQNLASVIKSGEVAFHLRNFYMSTRNHGHLLDYATMAIGGGIGYYSPSFKGFHVGFSGFFVFQIYEQNLRIPDPTTGNANRYEILLYDMNDFDNAADLDRLELLYLSYLKKDFNVVLGRQKVNTPLLNEQDNRMRPNIFSGLTFNFDPGNWRWTVGWYDHLTMRGTVDWYSVGDSFGVYPFGRNAFGTDSNYKGNVTSKGIGILGTEWVPKESAKVQLWNYHAQGVFNLHFIQFDHQVKFNEGGLQLGMQGFYEYTLGNGGNPDPEKSYRLPEELSMGIGSRIGYDYSGHAVSFNVLRIGGKGRFLFPREWGREKFYASLPRERFEGNGDLTALTFKYQWKPTNSSFLAAIGIGQVNIPEIENFNLNKYGLPSYYHFTGNLDYGLKGYFEGVELKMLVVNKTAKNPNNLSDLHRINRVDLWNLNLVMDYKF